MKGFEIPGHALSSAKSWDIVCYCGASFARDKVAAVTHVRIESLPLTSRAFCALWKMKRSTARSWLLAHGCRMNLRELKAGDDKRAPHWWLPPPAPEKATEF